jgi:hypothetical protein
MDVHVVLHVVEVCLTKHLEPELLVAPGRQPQVLPMDRTVGMVENVNNFAVG